MVKTKEQAEAKMAEYAQLSAQKAELTEKQREIKAELEAFAKTAKGKACFEGKKSARFETGAMTWKAENKLVTFDKVNYAGALRRFPQAFEIKPKITHLKVLMQDASNRKTLEKLGFMKIETKEVFDIKK